MKNSQLFLKLAMAIGALSNGAIHAEDIKCVEMLPSNSEFKREYVISREGEIMSISESVYVRQTGEVYSDDTVYGEKNNELLNDILEPANNFKVIADLRVKAATKAEAQDIGDSQTMTSYRQLVISPAYKLNEVFISVETLRVTQKAGSVFDPNEAHWESHSTPAIRMKCDSVAP